MKELVINFRKGKATKEEVIAAALKDNTVGAFRLVKMYAPSIYGALLSAKGIGAKQGSTPLTSLKGIGGKTAELLMSLGIADAEALAVAQESELSVLLQNAGSKRVAAALIKSANI